MAMAAMAEAAAAAMEAEERHDEDHRDKQGSASGEDLELTTRLRNAVFARGKYIREHAETLTMVSFRRLLEQDLGLETSALDPQKKQIKELVDQVLNADDTQTQHEIGQDTERQKEGETTPEVTETIIREALFKRSAYVKSNSESITLLGVRRLLEEDLALKEHALDPHKSFIRELLDEVLGASDNNLDEKEASVSHSEETKPQKKAVKEKITQERKRKQEDKPKPNKKKNQIAVSDNSEGDLSEENEADTSDSSEKKQAKRKPMKPSDSSKPVQSKVVEHLKQMIKSCGMSIPPSVYKRVKQAAEEKREDALIRELESILQKEGLNRNSSEKEIKAVKKRKDKQKDLEGIDVGNIITEGRGRRQASNFYSLSPPPERKRSSKVVISDDEESDKSNGKQEDSD